MRKVLCMILAFGCALTCFVGCGKGKTETSGGSEQESVASSGDASESSETEEPVTPAPVNTTVTKDEWETMFTYNNYSVSATFFEGTAGNASMKATENAIYQTSAEGDYVSEGYIVKGDDGCWYMLEQAGEIYAGVKIAENMDTSLGGFFFGDSDINFSKRYDEFMYDEMEKAYVLENEEIKAVFYVEDGKMIRIDYYEYIESSTDEFHYTFFDYGTTVVEIPEYTVVE